MDKLQEELNQKLETDTNLERIKFHRSRLDHETLKELRYLFKMDNINTLIYLSFCTIAGNHLDPNKNIIDQIKYQKSNNFLLKLKELEPDSFEMILIPRWIILIIGSNLDIKNYNFHYKEDYINLILDKLLKLIK